MTILPAGVEMILPHRSPEKSFTPIAGSGTVMLPRGPIATDGTLLTYTARIVGNTATIIIIIINPAISTIDVCGRRRRRTIKRIRQRRIVTGHCHFRVC